MRAPGIPSLQPCLQTPCAYRNPVHRVSPRTVSYFLVLRHRRELGIGCMRAPAGDSCQRTEKKPDPEHTTVLSRRLRLSHSCRADVRVELLRIKVAPRILLLHSCHGSVPPETAGLPCFTPAGLPCTMPACSWRCYLVSCCCSAQNC